MKALALVFVGAGLGGVARHLVNLASAQAFGPTFPFGTVIVNVVGSFAMGLLAVLFAGRIGAGWAQDARMFLLTGVLGGFTTFSAFSLDAVSLLDDGQTGAAVIYVVASVGLSILALLAGAFLMRSL
jgi:fluoride exporter